MKKATLTIWMMMLLTIIACPCSDLTAAAPTSPQLSIDLPGGGSVLSGDDVPAKNDLDNPLEEGFLINFNDLAIIEVIRFISKISNKNFIFDENDLNFAVTIVSEEPTSVDNILAALLQILRIHDLLLIEQGNNLLIHKNPKVQRPSQVVIDEEMEGMKALRKSELVTRVLRLSHTTPDKVQPIIETLLSEDAIVQVLGDTNHIVITDLATNIDRVVKLIHSLDSPERILEIGQYVVKSADVNALVFLGRQILAPIAGSTTVELVAHTPTDSIFIVSSPHIVERALAVLQTLDLSGSQTRVLSADEINLLSPEEEAELLETGRLETLEGETDRELFKWKQKIAEKPIAQTQFAIYKLQNRRAIPIQRALEQIGSSLSFAEAPNQDLVDAVESAQAIEESNSIVYSGTPEAIIAVRNLITELDVPLRQVFIEMLIIETTVTNSLNFGVEWGVRLAGSTNAAGTIGLLSAESTVPGALETFDPSGPSGGIPDPSGLGDLAGFSAGILGKILNRGGDSFTTLSALVKALEADGETEIVMNPKLIAEDNTPAEIFVGINTRFKTGSIASESGFVENTFEFRDVGSLMRVTPFLGDTDIVTLEIEQEISTATESEDATQDIGPTTRTARTTTRVHVPNKHFLIMSGMIQESRSKTKTSVPCLGGLPIAGAAFSDRAKTADKQNLMIFIRPQIIDTAEEVDRLTRDQHDLFESKSRVKKAFEFDVDTGLQILNLQKEGRIEEEEFGL